MQKLRSPCLRKKGVEWVGNTTAPATKMIPGIVYYYLYIYTYDTVYYVQFSSHVTVSRSQPYVTEKMPLLVVSPIPGMNAPPCSEWKPQGGIKHSSRCLRTGDLLNPRFFAFFRLRNSKCWNTGTWHWCNISHHTYYQCVEVWRKYHAVPRYEGRSDPIF